MKLSTTVLLALIFLSPFLHAQEETYSNISDGPQFRFWSHFESQRMYVLAGYQIDLDALEAARRMPNPGYADPDYNPAVPATQWKSPQPQLQKDVLAVMKTNFPDVFLTLSKMNNKDLFTILAVLSPRADAAHDFATLNPREMNLNLIYDQLSGRGGFSSAITDRSENLQRMKVDALKNMYTISLYSNLFLISQNMKSDVLETLITEQQQKDQALNPERMKIRDYSRLPVPMAGAPGRSAQLLESISGNFARLALLSRDAQAEIIQRAAKAKLPLLKSEKKLRQTLDSTLAAGVSCRRVLAAKK